MADVTDPAAAATISQEERSHSLNRLLALSDRSGRDPAIWKAEIEAALRGNPALVELLAIIKEIKIPVEGGAATAAATQTDKEFDHEIQKVLDSAIRQIAALRISLNDTQRAQITQSVHDDVYSHPLVRNVRWFLPLLGTIILGGTLFGIWKFDGLVTLTQNAAAEAKAQIQKKADEIDSFIIARKDGIGTVATAATTAINTAKQNAQDATTAATTAINTAKQTTQDATTAATTAINTAKQTTQDAATDATTAINTAKQTTQSAATDATTAINTAKQAAQDAMTAAVNQIKSREHDISDLIAKAGDLHDRVMALESQSRDVKRLLDGNQNIVEAQSRFNSILGMIPEQLRDAVLTATFWTTWLFNLVALLALGLSTWVFVRTRQPRRP
jgi:hypothetical protein